ncbi:hypothetical protein TWF173_002561 [Orbilia oligospora]|nr:hypothetical protein TWF173_002561 [Orbilia oligospora]
MGLFKNSKRTSKFAFRRSLLRAILPDSKTPPLPLPQKEPLLLTNSEQPQVDIEVDISDKKKAVFTTETEIVTVELNLNEPQPEKVPEILLLPAEILRDIFSYLDNCDLQSLYHTHSRFRGIVLEHRSFFCRELASRNLRYFARYPGQANIPAWYLKLYKLDKITKELYSLMPTDENEWELEYLRIQGLPPSQYNPRVWPRPGNPSFYFTHTIISFYQYNSLVKLPKDSLVDFKEKDVKPVCRCAQGYFRSTAHLGILCAVYMACLKFKAEEANNNNNLNKAEEEEKQEAEKDDDLSMFLPELGGGLGNYIKGTRVSVKELFKMVVVVMYPGNLLKVIKNPTKQSMSRLKIVLETLKDVLVMNEEERRQSGVDRMYTKGLEMMEGFAKYWEDCEDKTTLRYFDDWDLL